MTIFDLTYFTEESGKEKKPNGKLFNHSGGGDSLPGKNNFSTKEVQKGHDPEDSVHKGHEPEASSYTGVAAERIRQDDPPRMLGSKVAEVIERLLSFSTHLISIG